MIAVPAGVTAVIAASLGHVVLAMCLMVLALAYARWGNA